MYLMVEWYTSLERYQGQQGKKVSAKACSLSAVLFFQYWNVLGQPSI